MQCIPRKLIYLVPAEKIRMKFSMKMKIAEEVSVNTTVDIFMETAVETFVNVLSIPMWRPLL